MYKRVVKLEATDATTGDLLFETSQHRVTFNIDVGIAQGLAKSHIVIYNLADDENKKLTKPDLEPSSEFECTANRKTKKVRIRLYAGYADEATQSNQIGQLLVEGLLMNATSVKRLPESLTHLYIVAYGSNFLINKFDSFSTGGLSSGGMSLKDVLTKLLVSAGYKYNSIDFEKVSDIFLNQRVVGETFKNTSEGVVAILDDLAERFKFTWSVRNNGIGIYPQLRDSKADADEFNYLINGERFKIDPILVKGTPIAGIATMEIKYNFNTTLFPGVVIDVGDLGAQGNNDSLPEKGLVDYTHLNNFLYYTNDVSKYAVLQYYMVWRVLHSGDTHGEEWSSTLVCKVPSSGETSNEEV